MKSLGQRPAPAAAAALQAKQQQLAAAEEQARTVLVQKQTEQAAATVTAACSGSEPARLELERAASQNPQLFSAGFASQLAAAPFPVAATEEIVSAMKQAS
jgi:hypothetical protein